MGYAITSEKMGFNVIVKYRALARLRVKVAAAVRIKVKAKLINLVKVG